MPSVSRSLLIAVHAAAFSALLVAPLVSSSVMASPMAMPMPLRSADYRALNNTGVYYRKPIRTKETTRKNTRVKHITAVHHDDPPVGYISRRSGSVAVARAISKASRNNRRAHTHHNADSYNKLNGYYEAASTHSKNLRKYLFVDLTTCLLLILSPDSLAVQSSSANNDDTSDFHQQAATELTGFHTNMLGIEMVLNELGADKGLANYDRTNDLETLLKNIVNVNKDTLSYITTITYNLPIVGSTLGPSESGNSSIPHSFRRLFSSRLRDQVHT